MSSKPVEVLQSYLAAVENGNVEAVLALFHDDATVMTPLMPNAKPLVGRKSFEVAYQVVMSHFRRFQWINRELHATEDQELAIGRASGIGTLANGSHYDNDYAFFMRVKDGKIFEVTEYFSPLKAGAVSQK